MAGDWWSVRLNRVSFCQDLFHESTYVGTLAFLRLDLAGVIIVTLEAYSVGVTAFDERNCIAARLSGRHQNFEIDCKEKDIP